MSADIQPAVDALNHELRRNPRVVNVLLKRRYPAANDVTLTALSLINAALEPITGAKIAFQVADDGEIVGFSAYKGGQK